MECLEETVLRNAVKIAKAVILGMDIAALVVTRDGKDHVVINVGAFFLGGGGFVSVVSVFILVDDIQK